MSVRATCEPRGFANKTRVVVAAGVLMTLLVGGPMSAQIAEIHATCSPSGDWIAFDSNRTGQFFVYVVRPDGTGLRPESGQERKVSPFVLR